MIKTFVIGKDFRFSFLFLCLIIAFSAIDIGIDLKEGVSFTHILHEAAILIFSIFLVFFQFRVNFKKTNELNQVNLELEKVNQEREEFRQKVSEHVNALSLAAEEQFAKWGLTGSEREIAVLLIKGLAMKEIAHLRNSAEATVRQQATAIYRKSHLENRQQLAAFFLEDIF